MKKILSLVLLCMCTFTSFAQKYITIKGKVLDPSTKEVKLFKTVDGNLQVVATTSLSSDGSYGFLVSADKPGFYNLGSDRVNFVVYLKSGEEVNVDLERNKAILNGKNSKENKALYIWNDYSSNIRMKSIYYTRSHSTYKDFFPEYEKFIDGLPALKKQLKSGNSEFDTKLFNLVQYQVDYYATNFLMTPRTEHPKQSDWPAYYNTILSKDKFTTDEVLEYPEGLRMMLSYASFCAMSGGSRPATIEAYTDKVLSFLSNPRLKGEYVINSRFNRFKSYDQYLEAMRMYKDYFVTPSLKGRAEAIGSKLYETRAGSQAADFTYPDVNGKNASLSQFKGKVVLVDVWATWCGPCKKEIPYLIKLEEEMHGTDLVVLGVSLDEAKDKQKWIDFIKEKGLGGVQVNASGWTKITKDYKITGIPRFMVFDKKGNIVTTDAPRPSDPALKELLLKELNK